MKKRVWLIGILLVLAAVLLSGCAKAKNNTGKESGSFTEGLRFILSVDGTYYICRGFVDDYEPGFTLHIPGTYNGKPVKEISAEAFFTDTEKGEECFIQEIIVDKGVETIGAGAFAGLTYLRTVELPESLESIEMGAFQRCDYLTSVTLPKGLTSIGSGAFFDCISLTTVTLPEGLTSIGHQAFAGCSSLTTVTLPEGLTSISWAAFSGCSSLATVTIPDSVGCIQSNVFEDCMELEVVYIHTTGWCHYTHYDEDYIYTDNIDGELSDPSKAAEYLRKNGEGICKKGYFESFESE